MEWIAAVVVFGVVVGIYALGQGTGRVSALGRGLHEIREYKPLVTVGLEYRNENGIKTSRRVAVLKSLRHDDGRLFLLGFSGSRQPRAFRVDRIINVVTADGEVMDTRQFLIEALGIPPKLIAPRTA